MSVIDQLAGYDDSFSLQGVRIEKDNLPDGEYEFEVGEAQLKETARTHDTIMELDLYLLNGEQEGNYLKHSYFLRDSEAIKRVGADLMLLGFPANTWNAAHGKKLSVELPAAVARMKGIRLKASKKSNIDAKGKTWHNLYIRGALPGFTANDSIASAPSVSAPEDPF